MTPGTPRTAGPDPDTTTPAEPAAAAAAIPEQSAAPDQQPAPDGKPGPATAPAGRRRIQAVDVMRQAALLPALVILLIVGSLVSSAFLTVSNLSGVGQQISALGVVVVGESLILMIGGMDLSLESTYGLAPMLAAWLILPVSSFGDGLMLNPYLGILVLVLAGAVIGLINGLLIVKGLSLIHI